MSSTDASRTCVARDCSAQGLECGEIDDGNGGCFDCGRCTAPDSCGGGGERNTCGCTPNTCELANASCGEVFEHCTNTMIPCGMCTAPDTCGGAGRDNVCGHYAMEGQACNSTTSRCSAGFLCCPARGGDVCVATTTGGCPNALPDLIVDSTIVPGSVMIETKTFNAMDCAVLDACVVPGTRTLLRFTTQTPNIGLGEVSIGDPEDPPNNPDFVFSMCHVHFHYEGYMRQRLLDMNGTVVAEGFKAAFCLEDAVKALPDPDVPVAKKYVCGMTREQGIQPGWADYYGADLDCQWVDITGVAPGAYELELEVNVDGRIRELRRDNNRVRIPVMIP